MSEELKRITIADDGKSSFVSSEKGGDRLLAFFDTNYLVDVGTKDLVFDAKFLVDGGTYRATDDDEANNNSNDNNNNNISVK